MLKRINISGKTIALFLLALLLIGGLFYVFTNVPSISRYYENKKLEAKVAEMEKPYREDIYGGKTPEETYGLFIKALKAGDIELAAKYFSPKRQADWLKNLSSLSREKMNAFMSSLPDLNKTKKNVVKDDFVTFSYNVDNSPEEITEIQGKKITIPAGSDTYRIIFYKNNYTNKWKIEDL